MNIKHEMDVTAKKNVKTAGNEDENAAIIDR